MKKLTCRIFGWTFVFLAVLVLPSIAQTGPSDTDQEMKGKPEFKSEWMDATYMFTTAVRRDRFDKSPTKYAPQFGGYCAFAMTKGEMIGVDATVCIIGRHGPQSSSFNH